MKHLIMLSILVIVLLFPIQHIKAETINEDYLQYDSFQKRYYEHLTDLLYHTSVSYDSNTHYFKENLDIYREAVNNTFEEGYLNTFLNGFIDSTERLFTKPVALLGAAADFRTSLLEKVKSFFLKKDGNLGEGTRKEGKTYYIYPPDGYVFVREGFSENISFILFSTNYYQFTYLEGGHENFNWGGNGIPEYSFNDDSVNAKTFFDEYNAKYLPPISLKRLLDNSISPLKVFNEPTINNDIDNSINTINNNYAQAFPNLITDYEPTITPFLSCPSGNDVNLTYDNGTFYTLQMTRALITININSDGSAIYNNEDCNLDFKFPTIEINVNGEITADGESLIAATTTGDGENDSVEDLDRSLLDYVKNAYEFATSAINTGVEGLKSIVLGTSGLIFISTSFFDFLPPELLTLFIGGFAIALGLWVFKK